MGNNDSNLMVKKGSRLFTIIKIYYLGKVL